jgi:hypothetical protein
MISSNETLDKCWRLSTNTFNFVIDDIVSTDTGSGVVWHVGNDGTPLPFTSGCSYYILDKITVLIRLGYEIPEKAPTKMGYLRMLTYKYGNEPIRFVR